MFAEPLYLMPKSFRTLRGARGVWGDGRFLPARGAGRTGPCRYLFSGELVISTVGSGAAVVESVAAAWSQARQGCRAGGVDRAWRSAMRLSKTLWVAVTASAVVLGACDNQPKPKTAQEEQILSDQASGAVANFKRTDPTL